MTTKYRLCFDYRLGGDGIWTRTEWHSDHRQDLAVQRFVLEGCADVEVRDLRIEKMEEARWEATDPGRPVAY